MLRFTVSLLCVVGACSTSGPTSGVELTLRFDDSVSDSALASIDALSFVSSGDERGTYSFTLGRAAHREERLVYRPLPTSREIGLVVTASDVAGSVVATGEQPSIALDPTRATAIEITLVAAAADADAGLADAASSAADGGPTVDGGVAECTPTGEALCEDFESTLGSAWTPVQLNGTATIDSVHAHGGTRAMHFHGNAVSAGTTVDLRIAETETMTPLPSEVYVRAYYYFTSTPANGLQLSSLVESPAPYEGESLLFDGTELGVGFSVGAQQRLESSTDIPLDAWVCIEWRVHPATDATGTASVWLEDTELPGFSQGHATNPSSGLSVLSVGAETYAPGTASPVYDVWVDDVIVDVARIGCTP